MEVICPECRSRFNIPSAIKAGTRLRCSVCRSVFLLGEPQPAPAETETAAKAEETAPVPPLNGEQQEEVSQAAEGQAPSQPAEEPAVTTESGKELPMPAYSEPDAQIPSSPVNGNESPSFDRLAADLQNSFGEWKAEAGMQSGALPTAPDASLPETEEKSGENAAALPPIQETAPEAEEKSRKPLLFVAAGIVLLLIAGGIFLLGSGSSPDTQSVPVAENPAVSQQPAAPAPQSADSLITGVPGTQPSSSQASAAGTASSQKKAAEFDMRILEQLTLSEVRQSYASNAKAGKLLVIDGFVTNTSAVPVKAIALDSSLYGTSQDVKCTVKSFAGKTATSDQLATLPMEELLQVLSSEQNKIVQPGERVPFMVIFDRLPGDLGEYSVTLSSAMNP